jgi:hypothetical protein
MDEPYRGFENAVLDKESLDRSASRGLEGTHQHREVDEKLERKRERRGQLLHVEPAGPATFRFKATESSAIPSPALGFIRSLSYGIHTARGARLRRGSPPFTGAAFPLWPPARHPARFFP